MKTTLDSLLKQITPLPYHVGTVKEYASEVAECQHSIESGRLTIASSVEDLGALKQQAPHTFAYLTHAANVLPVLVEALNDCAMSLDRLDDKDGAYRMTCVKQAREALTAAREIDL